MNASNERHERGRNIYIIFIAICVLIIAAVIIFVNFFSSRQSDYVRTVYDSDSFFLRESNSLESRFALFKNNGDRITDYIFPFASTFINNFALVRNEDGEYGIIRGDGSMSVEFGKYEKITNEGGFYEAIGSDGTSLILGDGTKIGGSLEHAVTASESPFIILGTGGNSYKVLDIKGRQIATFDSEAEPSLINANERMFSLVHCDHHNLFLDNKSLSLIYDLGSDSEYRIQYSEPYHDAAVLVEAKDDEEGAKNIVTYYKGKIYDLATKCADVRYHDSPLGDTSYASCVNGDKEKLIRGGTITDISSDDDSLIFDEDHYAIYNADDKKLEIFTNGNSVAKIDSASDAHLSYGSYVVQNGDHQELYNLDGKQVYRTESANKTIVGMDLNEHIIIDTRDADAEKDDGIVIADKNGNSISSDYDRVDVMDNYLIGFKEDGTSDLFNKKAEFVTSGDYDYCSYYEMARVAFCSTHTDRRDIVDLDGKKVKASLTGESVNYVRYGYIVVMDPDKISYYTIDGKLFHEFANAYEDYEEESE